MNDLKEKQIELRRKKARAENFTLIGLPPAGEASRFTVRSPSGNAYQVEVNEGTGLQTCTCIDFAKNRLGTCKHVERARMELAGEGSPSGEAPPPPPKKTGPVLAFDLETQKSFDEVGGRDRFRELLISVAVTQDLNTGEFHTYHEKDVPKLVDQLFSASLVIGYNVKKFDYEVLSAYTDRPLQAIPTLDMLETVTRQLGHRLKLDQLVKATIGEAKTADGLQALRWFKEGKLDLIADYCRQDVAVTGKLYLFGKENGYWLYEDRGGELKRVPAAF